jgi:hypothetical protein
MAQFINPVTPDIAASCLSASVLNTGTSAFGDLQAVVVDGSDPSIIFIDYSTVPPTEFCFPIQAFAQGASVSDPDVVWDYSGSGLLLVVYESNLGPIGIWSEMWDWNGGSPTPVTGYGTGGFFNFSTGATYPNVDADVVGNAVVVWERAGDIEAMTVDFPTLTPSGNTCLVNVGGCGMNRSIEPDVAIRYFNGNSFVDFVMVDQGTPSGEIKTVFEKFTNVQSGFVTCIIHTVQHAGGITPTAVRKPRIDMPTYWNSLSGYFRNEFACSVFYELIDGGSSYIGSSQLQDVAGASSFIPPINVVFEQTYSPPVFTNYEWISDIMNAWVGTIVTPAPSPFDIQLNSPVTNLDLFQNNSPVTTFAGDQITYVAWDWNNTGFAGRPNNTPEILSRRLTFELDGNTTFLAGTLYNHVIPAPTTTRYFAVGEGYNIPEPQTVVSIDGTDEWVYYMFTGPQSGRVYYKRSVQDRTAAVRQANTQNEMQQKTIAFSEITLYPNPATESIRVFTGEGVNLITIIGADGKRVKMTECNVKSKEHELQLNTLIPGIYTVMISNSSNESVFRKLVVVK